MIFNEADKGPTGGGPSEPATPAAEEPAKPAATEPARPAAEEPAKPAAELKPTIVQKLTAMISDKSELLATIARHEKAATDLQGKLSIAEARIVTLEKDLADFEQIKGALKKAEENTKTVSAAAVDVVASLGFPENKLPAANADGADGETPKDIAAFQKTHGELVQSGKTDAASKFYDKYAKKFGL